MADDHRAIVARERLPSQKIQRHADCAAGDLRGAEIIRRIASTLAFEIGTASIAVARALRHQHRKAARDQRQSEMRVVRLRHLCALDLILDRRMRDDRNRKRSLALRTK